MQKTKTPLIAAIRDGDKFQLKTPYNPRVKEWLKSLPNARWNKKRLAWRCDATPAAAHRILNEAPARVEADESVRRLAQNWSVVPVSELPDEQPELRTGDSWNHQLQAYWFAYYRNAALFAMAMGTGKSKPVVDLIVNKGWRKVMILCPTTVRSVWRREIEKWAARPVEVLVLDKSSWTTRREAQEAEKFLTRCEGRDRPAVIVQNYESAAYGRKNRMPFGDWALGHTWDAVICDESHRIAKPDTNVSKFASKLRPRAQNRLCLTGTPFSHSPLDSFGQSRFLDPGVFGTSWHRFRNRYAVSGPYGANHIVDYQNQDELAEKMALFTYQVDKDVLDLPESVSQSLVGELPDKARRVYDEIEEEFVSAVDQGVVTVANGLVKLLRLQQITSGFVAVDDMGDGSEELTWLGDEKQRMLAGLLEDMPATEPVVVFCRFREDLNRICQVAEDTGRRYGEISGSRKDLTSEGTMPEDVDLMGVQISSGGVGIDLTRACYAVYYSIGYSLTDYDQSVARIHRPGQERTTFYYHLVLKDTVDEVVYRALQKRKDLVEEVIGYLKNFSENLDGTPWRDSD